VAELTTKGFHHVTMVARDAQRTTNFYRDLLGFGLVKQTVNFDVPDSYHLYFGKDGGAPGTLLTFFEWPNASRGYWGIGGIHHVAMGVSDPAQQLKWKRRLTDAGVPVSGPYDRGYFKSIYFQDPDGQILEIATEGPGFAIDEPANALGQDLKEPPLERLPGGRNEAAIEAETHPEPVTEIDAEMALSGIHHITGFTDDLAAAGEDYEKALGLKLIKKSFNQDDPSTLHYFWANYDGETVLPASDITFFGWPRSQRRAREGVGQTHHVAFRAANLEELLAWQDHLRSLGYSVSDVRDRVYFKSIYFRASDDLLLEIATDPPGFTVDEAAEELGLKLQLPSWLEPNREKIAAGLKPLS
jgi:glyoxalase family protein